MLREGAEIEIVGLEEKTLKTVEGLLANALELRAPTAVPATIEILSDPTPDKLLTLTIRETFPVPKIDITPLTEPFVFKVTLVGINEIEVAPV